MAAAATAVLAPTIASAAAAKTASDAISPLAGTDLQVSFSTSTTGQKVVLKNTSSTPIGIKHVNPGIVHANGKTYDINSVLNRGALTIEANSSVAIPINPVAHAATEKALPSDLTFSHPFTVSTHVKTPLGTIPVTTLRSFLV